MSRTILYDQHINYFLSHLRILPEAYSSQDSNRIVLVYFCVHGLALLGALDRINKSRIIEWIYSLQMEPDCENPEINWKDMGFRGGSFGGHPYNSSSETLKSRTYDTSNIAATYSALALLLTLGDDLSRINKKAIIKALKNLQCENGSFISIPFGSEEDLRFVYCACAISYILKDWSGINPTKTVEYINSCRTFDSGIGISPGIESQGGATFCAIASLSLIESLDQLKDQEDLIRWLLFRQVKGFQGRCNKDPDSCYSFWNGGSLKLLNVHDLIDIDSNREFILTCESKHGGFSKFPDCYPDVMHSYYSLAWLSIANEKGLVPLDTHLSIPLRDTSVRNY